jgi:isopentenyl-diphosphate delta-isomerase
LPLDTTIYFFIPLIVPMADNDPNAKARKKDHIELAFRSQVTPVEVDPRFFYEPIFAAHPEKGSWPAFSFLNKPMRLPIWVSSMTGGTEWAGTINHNLAKACRDFGMGMGLGSCRSLLYSDDTLPDFAVRDLMGPDAPLFANLGVAQIETLIDAGETDRILRMIDKLRADGLIIHVNPFQEWLQPEGDRYRRPALDAIEHMLRILALPIIVKEVGQGMGRESLKTLLQLPIAALDFAASGGTNFAKLELLRNEPAKQEIFQQLAHVGHTAVEMVHIVNDLIPELGDQIRCQQLIISGGIQSFLDGYYLIRKSGLPAVYGQASAFLRHARGSYDALAAFVQTQAEGLELANAFLSIKK